MSWFFQRTISEDDLVDLKGKVAIVTGGNTGVGYGTAQFLVRRGAKVYIAARNESRTLAAIEQLKAEDIKDGSLHWLKLDLSDPRLAKKAADEFLEMEERLDILVNNAATGGNGPFSFDKDGLLNIMVTNHISPYIFTRTLLPLLIFTAERPNSDVRIINVTSIAHSRVHPTTFKGKESVNKDYGNSVSHYLETYGHSKLANILHMNELQRMLDAEWFAVGSTSNKVLCLSVHPGTIKTQGTDAFFDSVPYVAPVIKFIGSFFFAPWRNGGMNVAWAAAGKTIATSRDDYRGKYVVPVATVITPSPEARDERLAKELRESTEEILRELGL